MNNLNNTTNQKPNKKQEVSSVQAVDRALKLLTLIADSNTPVLAADLAVKANLNRTTVWRLLATLEGQDFIERDPFTKGYQLGYASTKLISGMDQYNPLIRRARRAMEQLLEKVHESVLLSVPKTFGVLTIDQINPSNQSIRVADYINSTMPLHGTSNGKLLLSYLSQNELDILLDRKLEQFTLHTITDREKLYEEIELIRKQGFATNFLESDENENGISAPILDKQGNLVSFLSVSGPSFRFSKEKVLSWAPTVIASAKEITHNLEK
ncbi:IclR family transcriptional regulator [Domibacillus mangrovi]|uniref:Transcriptional regulator n=1 Tax=Domibacillus mangrovi TaxID=1714354 RepID=A0A1Q5P093_9BACI|nr:IclR family transcriptional regulator [Domibacillus mangrovi]OKL35616.1 transcriptional regulator [Domibacillus mangrovi]